MITYILKISDLFGKSILYTKIQNPEPNGRGRLCNNKKKTSETERTVPHNLIFFFILYLLSLLKITENNLPCPLFFGRTNTGHHRYLLDILPCYP